MFTRCRCHPISHSLRTTCSCPRKFTPASLQPTMDNDSNSDEAPGEMPEEYKWLQEQLQRMQAQGGGDVGDYEDDEDGDWEDPTGGVLRDLLEACEQGDVAQVEALAEKLTVDINTPGPDGDTGIHLACLFGHKAVVELLLSKGADANAVNEQDGSTPLHDAAASGYIEICQLLLVKCSDDAFTVTDEDGDTVLHHAARANDLDICKLFVERGANPLAKNSDGRTPGGEADEEPVMQYLSGLEKERAAAAAKQ